MGVEAGQVYGDDHICSYRHSHQYAQEHNQNCYKYDRAPWELYPAAHERSRYCYLSHHII